MSVTNRVALLLLRDVLLDVLVSPVEHQLHFLLAVHPHDLLAHFLNDSLELLQLLRPVIGQLLARENKVTLNT